VCVRARARVPQVALREDNFCQIVNRLGLHPTFPDTGMDFLHQHDHVFWFGDLNYRVLAARLFWPLW
jgi:hypothetical protein